MSINLTTALQNIGGRDPNYVSSGSPNGDGPTQGARQVGLVLEDSATVTWTADPTGKHVFNVISATASGATLPTATGAGQVLTATGPGTTYTAQGLPVGSASQGGIVEVDGTTITATDGVISAVPAGMVLIQNKTLSGTEATVTFSAIPQSFTNLLLVCSTLASGVEVIGIQFNGDSGANYNYLSTVNVNGTVTGSYAAGTNSAGIGASGTTGGASSVVVNIPQYSQAALAKTAQSQSIQGATAGGIILEQFGAIWANTNAITSIVMSLASAATFSAGSSFSLYGLQ